MLFNISGTIQPKEDKSIINTPWTAMTRRHRHITLNRYHRSLIHHWPHGDTLSLVRNILRKLRRQCSALNNIDDIILHHYGPPSNIYTERMMLNFSHQCSIIYALRYSDLKGPIVE